MFNFDVNKAKSLMGKLNPESKTIYTIDWSDNISVEKYKEDLTTKDENDLLNNVNALYIIEGFNNKNDGFPRYYIGKADGCSVLKRLLSHMADDDIKNLHDYRSIKVGIISEHVGKDIILQIESMLIMTTTHDRQLSSHMCNDKSSDSYRQYRTIDEIHNEGNINPLPPVVVNPVQAGIARLEKGYVIAIEK